MKNKILIGLIVVSFFVTIVNATYIRYDRNVVYDTLSALTWQDDHNGTTNTNDMNITVAINYCEDLTLGGYSDWRLPNYNELYNLAERNATSSALPAAFINRDSDTGIRKYWTSTTYTDTKTYGWVVSFQNGQSNWELKTSKFFVRCVRGGQQ